MVLIRGLYLMARVYWLIVQPVSVGTKGIVRDAQGRVLLVRHAYGQRRRWDLPGGHVRRGERVDDALAREVREECGVTVSIASLLGLYYQTSERKHDHIAVFLAEAVGVGGDPHNPEIAGFGFFPLDGLPPLSTGARARLEELGRLEQLGDSPAPIIARW